MPSNTFTLGGHTFTSDQIITAIQESDNANTSDGTDVSNTNYNTLVDSLKTLRGRVEELELSVRKKAGFFVSKLNNNDGSQTVKVSMQDENEKTILVTFDIPAD